MTTAFLFPGQGSQSVGMMAGLAAHGEVRSTFDEASEALGEDLWKLASEGPDAEINLTSNTQPVMLAAGVATYRAYLAAGGRLPSWMAGHSLGEYTALVAAEALTLKDAVKLVRFRANAMQSAVPEGVGAMAAVLGLDDDAVAAVCSEAADNEVLEAVNLNSPGQVVIAGNKTAVERGMALAKERGAKRALLLPVSVPSHSSLMKPAAEKLAVYLSEVRMASPRIPVFHNADVAEYSEPEKIKDALARQLYSPVRWVETILALKDRGADRFVECGPGKVLAGLNKRIDSSLATLAITDDASLQAARE
jgi:[acyl-carrier-protein] S-malonyltransferase